MKGALLQKKQRGNEMDCTHTSKDAVGQNIDYALFLILAEKLGEQYRKLFLYLVKIAWFRQKSLNEPWIALFLASRS